jgi:formylglycine-generating enzyme required for sulfatase activity
MDKRIKVAAVLLLIGGSYWLYQTLGTATLAITSEPSGAQVRVDGRVRGLTPINRLELDTGSHKLEISHSYFRTHVEGMTLRRGDHLVKNVTLAVGEGTLSLLSNPRGAWVEVDGVRLPDPTPTTLKTQAGERSIVMGQAERRAVAQVHTLQADKTLEVNFNLNIDPHGTFTLTTTPRNAVVEFVGKDIVYTPQIRIPIGEYTLSVSKPGYATQTFRHTVRYGDNLHQVTLAREYGSLKVATTPADADVEVTFADAGKSRRKTYTRDMQVPVGKVEVRARALGHRTAFRSLNMTRQGASLQFDLQPMSVEIGRVFTDPLATGGHGPELVIIPAGEFVMGNAAGPPSERPPHTVMLAQPFAVSRYEITIGEYLPYLKATGGTLHERLNAEDLRHGMAYVSHADATRYAQWLSRQTGQKYRLLSESEWEYVARAGTSSTYFFGEDPEQLCQYANVADRSTRQVFRQWDTLTCDDQQVRPGPVGKYQPNNFGVYDIYGNVAEWVADCGLPEYTLGTDDGAAKNTGDSCNSHGVRGGSWDSQAVEASSAYRFSASSANDDRGIRLLREL